MIPDAGQAAGLAPAGEPLTRWGIKPAESIPTPSAMADFFTWTTKEAAERH